MSNKEAVARYRARHPERVRAASAKWCLANPRYKAEWVAANLDKSREYWARSEAKRRGKRGSRKPELQAAADARYRAANPDKLRVRRAARRALEAGAAVSLTLEERVRVNAFYAEARFRTEATGVVHHVDHVVPLSKGGTHHPDNLQVLTAAENVRKGNKW